MEKRMRKATNINYVVVGKLEKKETEGYEVVEVQDQFVYKGVILRLPDCPVYVDNYALQVGDVVLFAKYSPDTHEIEGNKFVKVTDILEVWSGEEVD